MQYVQILPFQHVAPAIIQVFNMYMWLVATCIRQHKSKSSCLISNDGSLLPSLPTLTWNTDTFPDSPKQS